MKKEQIKKISDRALMISYMSRYGFCYLGYDLMGRMANNSFVKSMLMFNYYSYEKKEAHGITYKKEINSVFYKALLNIAEQLKSVQIVDGTNNVIEYEIEVNKKTFSNNWNYSFFKIILSDTTIEMELKKERLDILIRELRAIWNLNTPNLISILNCCVNGSLPLFTYEYEVKNEEQVFYSFKQDIFVMMHPDKLLLEARDTSYNPYEIENYKKLENNRKGISNSLSSGFANLVPSYFSGKGKNRILEYFKLDTLFLDYTLPVHLNMNKQFNDADAIFKFKEGYSVYQGRISAKRFLELKDEQKHSLSKIQDFLASLELIEG